MPKLKTNSSVKGRFRLTASGKVRGSKAFKRHCLSSKSNKMKRQARNGLMLSEPDAKIIRRNFMPYAR